MGIPVKIFGVVAAILLPLGAFVAHQVINGNKLDTYLNLFKSPASSEDETSIGGSTKGLEGGGKKETTPKYVGYRLPSDILPKHYDLRLRTDLEDGTFEGTVDIEIACTKPTSVVRLHAKELDIDVKNVRVNELEIKGIEVAREESDNDFLVIRLREELPAGIDHIVRIPFSGRLDGRAGYRLTKYSELIDNQPETRLMAVTQFEPSNAREAFPCFDEPHMKATFALHLGHKQEYKAISNMPLAESSNPDEDGWTWDDFQTSEAMSTYTVAFVIFDPKTITFTQATDNLRSSRIWGRHRLMLQVVFVSEMLSKLVKFYENYFATKYPLNKIDLVSVPELSHDGMENWGLITVREDDILLNKDQSNARAQFLAGSVVAQALAHQWIGNMVTMKWWSDAWLTKGIASYVSSLALQQIFSETWTAHEYNFATRALAVFSYDSLESSQPVSVAISSSRDTNQIYDDTTQQKGWLILHMLASILGPDKFKTGVGSFLKQFSFATADQDAFWEAVTSATDTQQVLPPGVGVKEFMDSWTKQPGFPVLNVKVDSKKVTISQKRLFRGKPKSEDAEADKGCWYVPVTFANEVHRNAIVQPTANTWLSCENREVTFDINPAARLDYWIILNEEASGLYRVNYDEATWDIIINFLLTSSYFIPHKNLMMLVSDAMELAYVGQLPYQKAFLLLRYTQSEMKMLPWLAVSSSLEDIRNLLIRTDKYDVFKYKAQTIVAALFNRYVRIIRYMKGNALAGARLLTLAYELACKYELNNCMLHTKQLWSMSRTPPINEIQRDVRGTVYCEVVRQGGEPEWNEIFKNYRENQKANERRMSLEALGCASSEELLKRYLDLSLEESSGILKQDSWRIFWATADYSALGFQLALNFLQNKLKAIYDYNKPDTAVLGKYFTVLAKKLVFKDEVDKMKQFVSDNKELLKDCWKAVSQAVDQMDVNLHWHETHYNTIETALNS